MQPRPRAERLSHQQRQLVVPEGGVAKRSRDGDYQLSRRRSVWFHFFVETVTQFKTHAFKIVIRLQAHPK